jgi:hypothetical protein
MSRMFCRSLGPLLGAVFTLGFWAGPEAAQAEMFLGSMSPGSVVRGGTTRVTLRGTELGDPLDLWTSVDGDRVRAQVVAAESNSQQVVLDVTAAKDCPLGLHGLRLATDDGLTNLVLFLVDDLKPMTVQSDADSARSAFRVPQTALALPVSIAGTFRATEIDRFAIEVVAGQEVSFECVASRIGKDADPLIRILDARGKLIAEHDNDAGLFFDFRFAHQFTAAGRYVVELCDARYHGDPDWQYVLRMGSFPAARVVVPSVVTVGGKQAATLPELPDAKLELAASADARLGPYFHEFRRNGDNAATWLRAAVGDLPALSESEPNDSADQATKGVAPTAVCGVLQRPGDRDFYEFDLKKGDRVFVRAVTAGLDSPADVELAWIAEDGREVTRVDDVKEEEAYFTTNSINKDGKYRLLVHDVTRGGGPAHAYRVEVRPAEPQLTLVADFADVTLPQGEFQSLPLVLTRTDYSGPVKLELLGAPSGVTLEPNEIPEGATTLLARLRATDAAPLGKGTLQIVGSAEIGDKTVSALATVQPSIDRERYNVDLIKYALRENQKRLPPSASNRIALQITPPSPFSVETPDPLVTLVRYLSQPFPLQIARRDGFAGELQFKAVGGQLGEESEIRRQIFTRFTPGTVDHATVTGTFYSRNLPQEQKHRVDLSTDGEHQGRRVSLVRSFELQLKAGYAIAVEPASIVVAPGEATKLQLTATRLPPFTGPIEVEIVDALGLNLPETLTIAPGATTAELEIKTKSDAEPSKWRIRFNTKAQVGEFQEEGTPRFAAFEIKIPPPPKPMPAKPDPKAVKK